MGQLDDIEEANIPFPALHTAHIVTMQVGQLCQLLLRQLALQPELAYSSTEHNARVTWHAVIIETVTTMSLHTMSVIHFERIPVRGASMSDQPQDVQVILKRIDVLERQNRWLVRAGLVASLLAVAAVTMGQARTSRTVEAEQFILRDAQGRQRLTIGTPRFSGVAIGLEADRPAIWITGSNGVDRAILTSDGIYWADEHGKGTARIEGVGNRGSGPPTTLPAGARA